MSPSPVVVWVGNRTKILLVTFPWYFNFFFFTWWPVVTVLFICPSGLPCILIAKPKWFGEGMSSSGRSPSLFSTCRMQKMWLGLSVHRKTPLPPCECKSCAPQIQFSINLWERIWAKRVWACCCGQGELSLPAAASVPDGHVRAVCAPRSCLFHFQAISFYLPN